MTVKIREHILGDMIHRFTFCDGKLVAVNVYREKEKRKVR